MGPTSPGDSFGDAEDRAGPALGVRALLLLLHSAFIAWAHGERWGPPGVWAPVPERREVEGDEQGDVVAPEPAALITLECSGVGRPMADRMLFPFIPVRTDTEDREETETKQVKGSWASVDARQRNT